MRLAARPPSMAVAGTTGSQPRVVALRLTLLYAGLIALTGSVVATLIIILTFPPLGLGLAIVTAVARAHYAHLTLTPTPRTAGGIRAEVRFGE